MALQRHGIPCHIVPGITAASGCAAATGIPLTHRDHAQSVRFVTGHCRDGGLKLDWRALVSDGQTLVFYMGLALGASIAEQLMRHGMSAETPVGDYRTRHSAAAAGAHRHAGRIARAADSRTPTVTRFIGDWQRGSVSTAPAIGRRSRLRRRWRFKLPTGAAVPTGR
ncbi:Siroheme synthase [Serratia odorifera]|uniref:Siroheme synthase n=1 Tax=Serratia odorifera TaxID=618 RepID=A0A3S4HSW6_SEROD|nr:Siroheme synthase [Serratia odorifera]